MSRGVVGRFAWVVLLECACGDVTTPRSGDAGGDAGGDVQPEECDPSEVPGDGVYVSASDGDDDAGEGSALLPFATIQAGVGFAVASGKSTIYLEEGTYREAVRIRDSPAGVFLSGGWTAIGGTWTRNCAEGVTGRTVIAAPAEASTAVLVEEVVHASGMRLLTVTTKAEGDAPADQAGQTLFGVHVRGEGSVFTLVDVVVLAGDGGDGGPASPGTGGATGGGCDGTVGCLTGARGADAASAGRPAEQPGAFLLTGYVPGDGSPGDEGSAGEKGTPPAFPPESRNCLRGCSCNGSSCDEDGTDLVSGGSGTCGCPGGGGGGGRGGRGGGASVALVVEGADVNVSVERGALRAGEGGRGSDGGDGGSAGTGSVGSAGGSRDCYSGCSTGGPACDAGGSCYSDGNDELAGGGPGGPGGDGGDGSRGGAGAGGPAYAVLRLGDGTVVTTGTEVSFGAGGTGAGSGARKAPDAPSGAELVVPR